MRLEINLKIFFVIILFFVFNYLDIYFIFLIFIFLHEFSHLLWGVIIGGKPKSICINPLGVSLEFYSYGKANFHKKIILFSIGPIINFLFAIFFLKTGLFSKYNQIIVYTNFTLAVFNLIPIIPLDGGKILLEIVKLLTNKNFANKFMIIFSKTFLIISTFVYSILILKIKNLFILLILIYLWILYINEERKYFLYNRLKNCLKIKA